MYTLKQGTDIELFSCLLVPGQRVVKVSFIFAADSEYYRQDQTRGCCRCTFNIRLALPPYIIELILLYLALAQSIQYYIIPLSKQSQACQTRRRSSPNSALSHPLLQMTATRARWRLKGNILGTTLNLRATMHQQFPPFSKPYPKTTSSSTTSIGSTLQTAVPLIHGYGHYDESSRTALSYAYSNSLQQ